MTHEAAGAVTSPGHTGIDFPITNRDSGNMAKTHWKKEHSKTKDKVRANPLMRFQYRIYIRHGLRVALLAADGDFVHVTNRFYAQLIVKNKDQGQR